MIANVKMLLEEARRGGYAIGAFNTVNLETTRAIVEAAKELHSPVILQVTEKTLDYAGGRALFHLMKNMAEFYAPDIPMGIHLDHGKSFEAVERAMEIGFTSVMYDGSRKEDVDNIMTTQKVVELAHLSGVVVQAELGNVPYLGEIQMETVNWDEYMTDPDQVADFVEKTKVDTLAIAIGNAHGFFRERAEPDYERLERIARNVSIPLVLHGASDWQNGRVTEVIQRGVSCFNVDTASRLSFVGGLKRALQSDDMDIRKIMGTAKDCMKESVRAKIFAFGSADKA